MLGFVIGDGDMITGFRLVGVEGVEVSSINEARRAFNAVLTRNEVAIVIVSQAFSSQPEMREELDKVRRERRSPLIVEIPPSSGTAVESRLSETVSKILGFRV